MRDREEPVATRAHQVDEGRLVAPLRRLDEIAIHVAVLVTSVGDVVHQSR